LEFALMRQETMGLCKKNAAENAAMAMSAIE
jgi:hypothetical protein